MKIGIVQSGPVYLDLAQSMEKALGFMEDAARQGVELLVFGETWLSGYPAWLDYCPEVGLWNHPPTKKVFARMYQNSIDVAGEEMATLQAKARQLKLFVVMGINEVVKKGIGQGTIYNSFVMINEEGQVLNHHRKLMPTYTEKTVYGIGDGYGLKSVASPWGRISALICWEHWMPLSRQALHDSGEHIHIALWPKVHEMHQVASRQYAFEGRCFVIAAGQMMQAKEFPTELKLPDALAQNPDRWVLDGNSCIIGPDGYYRMPPQLGKEGLLVHEILDMDAVYEERMTLDVSGHYQRQDVFDFWVDRYRPSEEFPEEKD